MKRLLACVLAGWAFAASSAAAIAAGRPAPSRFTPLVALPPPKVFQAAEAYPGGAYEAANLVDGVADGRFRSEYASASKGTATFADFDFGGPTRIAAFKHIDRFDPATVATSELLFSDDPGFAKLIARVPVKHANKRGGVTLASFEPVTARYVRWQVTAVESYATVGGAEVGFFSAAEPEPAPKRITLEPLGLPALVEENGKFMQPFQVTIRYPYAEPADAVLAVSGAEPIAIRLVPAGQTVNLSLPAAEAESEITLAVQVGGQTVAERRANRKPVRPWVLYILPHSHVDIGYTHVQTEVERKQWGYLEQAVELVRRTADHPPEARFKWNSEVLWAVDSYLKQAPPEKRQELLDAVRQGSIELDALYGNELTALCRPEELFRLVDCARRISREHGVAIDSAMISDVPGYTWGIVPALAQSGVKYFSIGPNHVHRIGYTLADWGDRPFYWLSPSGQERVLCWMAGKAYSWFHGGRLGEIEKVDPRAIFEYLGELEDSGYPYDMVQVRYSIGGDNGPPDPNLPGFVQQWNARYVHPKMAIATARELFTEFEHRYGGRLPEVRGDFTPYWEDGAGSSARETALARNASERLVQAEALWAMLRPREYPSDDFYAAWRNVILYNEHTWGAHCSISQPESQFTLDQWKIKQAFALDADSQSRRLLESALPGKSGGGVVAAVDVYNTTSWARSDLVELASGMPLAGDRVRDHEGRPVPSQRQPARREGETRLVFLAKDVPPLGAKRFFFEQGEPLAAGGARAEGNVLSNQNLRLTLDETTGAIASLTWRGAPVDLVDRAAGLGLDDYFYVPGRDPAAQKRNGAVNILTSSAGPLEAVAVVLCHEAPGCRRLVRVIRLIDGIDRVDVTNIVDRQRVLTPDAVHFGFAFQVPQGVMRLDVPWAIVRPEVDQLPGACKNYFTVGRWIDVSNDEFGVTWATVDAPLAEVGAITVDVPRPFDPTAWIRRLEPTQRFYSYVMNNYWETNYKASQEGTARFRYSIAPHAGFDPAAAARFGIERSQPLVVVPVEAGAPLPEPLFRIQPESVIVSSLKPSEDRKAWMVRLFNPSGAPVAAAIHWQAVCPARVALSSPQEEQGAEVSGRIELPGYGIATLRAELPD